MASNNNTDYLRFSAYSLKELITRKLAADTKFTDLIYEGSNLAVLIDIVCYMYLCMLYSLNNAASEAMWSDTQIYENINRLAKLIGYSPKGASPSTAVFCLNRSESKLENTDIACCIPKYALIDTKMTDENGKKIYFSTVQDYLIANADKNEMLMYNGIWKLYQTIFLASGEQYLTLYLDLLTSDDEKKTYVSQSMIDVYVESPEEDEESRTFEKWSRVEQGLFTDNDIKNGLNIYNLFDKIYSVRLNEDKKYEISFGNGFNGAIPKRGSAIYVFYLDSNGPLGKIDLGDVQDAKIKHDSSVFGVSKRIYTQMFGKSLNEITNANEADPFSVIKDKGKWQNTTSSTIGKVEEDVESIRRNAPQAFKTANRLVTATDWEYYIKNKYSDNVLDVVCLNNYRYISTFYRWLYNLGVKMHDSPQYYLAKNKIVKYDYQWADAHDSNNVYLWIKTKNDADIYKDTMNNDVQDLKVLTQESVFLKPLDVLFMICAQDEDEVRYNLKNNDMSFDGNYLEVTITDNTLYANSDITLQVIQAILNYFSEDNFTLGAIVNSNDLANKIFEIGTVSRIRTVYRNKETRIERIFPGISFASWTSTYIDVGDDAEVTTVSKTLEPFLFPQFYSFSSLASKIKIIRRSIGQLNNVQY